jgi:hypothetical protein
MLKNQQHRQAGQSMFMSSINGLANLIGVIAGFLVGPMAYSKTIEPIQRFTIHHYGYGWEDITAFVWFVICALVVFFIARASIGTALVMGGLAIVTKLM